MYKPLNVSDPGRVIESGRKGCEHGHCGCYSTNGNRCCFCAAVEIEPWKNSPKPIVRKQFGENAIRRQDLKAYGSQIYVREEVSRARQLKGKGN